MKHPREEDDQWSDAVVNQEEEDSDFDWFTTASLVELFSVRILTRTPLVSSQVLGHIHSVDGKGRLELFDSEKCNNSTLICEDGSLCLTGPSRCIRCPSFGVHFSIKDKLSGEDLCTGAIGFDVQTEKNFYNTFCQSLIKGKSCFGLVHYAVLDNAAQASVEITINDPDVGPAVHGSIYASNGNLDATSAYKKMYYRSMLFMATNEMPAMLQYTDASAFRVPLIKSAVAVPLDSYLIIDADLFDPQKDEASSRLLKTIVSFEARPKGELTKTTRDGRFTVKVTWLAL